MPEHCLQYINASNSVKIFLSIPSISADLDYLKDIKDASQFLIQSMNAIGMDSKVLSAGGNPIVYGHMHISNELPTILIYGHYDVQPPDPIALWNTPPFEPTIIDGKMYARGACDDKAQVYLVLKALELMVKNNQLQCNIKLLFEGEEEIGSKTLETFIENNKPLLKSDAFLVCDTAMESNDQPTLINSLRGICYCEILIEGAPIDLHSGMYGGVVINPLTVLCSIISKLKDDDHNILIPGFYDNITDSQNKVNIETNEDSNQESFYAGEIGYHNFERMTSRPTLDVHGISGGYIGEGPKTVIPSKASAKISMRLVIGQDEEIIFSLLEKYLKSITPKEVSLQLIKLTGSNAIETKTDSIACMAADFALTTVFGQKPTYLKIGGTIPVVSMVKKHLNLDPILMGFGLDSDNIHGPNEHFHIANFFKGIEAVSTFITCYGEQVRLLN